LKPDIITAIFKIIGELMDNQTEYYDQVFNQSDIRFSLSGKIFEACKFKNCDLAEVSLSSAYFSDCSFIECNVSLSDTLNTRFSDISFSLCKISGLDFTKANPFLLHMDFDDCLLSYCSFSSLKLDKSKFISCKIDNCDFYSSSLVSADFSRSTFAETIFDNTDLSKANFTDARGYSINPQTNKITKAVFSMPDVINLLNPLDIIIK